MKKYHKIIGFILFIALVVLYILAPLADWKLLVAWVVAGAFFTLWRMPFHIKKRKKKKVKRYV